MAIKRSTPTDAPKALQRAFSLREKALRLARECADARRAGKVGDPEFHSLQKFYATQAERAHDRIVQLREEHRRRADLLRRELQDTARRQAELNDLVMARDIGATKANRLNRRFQQRIAELRARVLEEERLASAQSVEDVGGLIDVPLAGRAEARPGAGTSLLEPARLAATAVAVVGSLSVFLRWLVLDGDPLTLAGAAARFGVQQRMGLAFAGLLVFFVVLPLVGAVFAWIENRRIRARGMAATGLVVAILGLLATAGAAVAAAGQYLLPEVLIGLRWGAYLYVLSGVALVVLGVRQGRAAEPLARTKPGSAWLMAGAALAILAVAFVTYFATRSGFSRVDFAFTAPDPGSGAVGITAVNHGNEPAALYVPWPEGRPNSSLVERPRHAYGLLLYVREPGNTEFRLYPASQDCWLRQGSSAALPGAPVTVDPEVPVTITLDPYAARQGGIDPEAVRIVATDIEGDPVASYESDVAPR